MRSTAASPDFASRHLRFGWWALLVFTCAGLALETLHAFKVRAYLDVGNETRRLMWTLAHAHGTLLSVINVVFGVALRAAPPRSGRSLGKISVSFIGATLLLPAGFLLGGVRFYDGDPGLGAALVPVGGALMLIGLFLTARLYTLRDRDP
jgi:hypothetical protein